MYIEQLCSQYKYSLQGSQQPADQFYAQDQAYSPPDQNQQVFFESLPYRKTQQPLIHYDQALQLHYKYAVNRVQTIGLARAVLWISLESQDAPYCYLSHQRQLAK